MCIYLDDFTDWLPIYCGLPNFMLLLWRKQSSQHCLGAFYHMVCILHAYNSIQKSFFVVISTPYNYRKLPLIEHRIFSSSILDHQLAFHSVFANIYPIDSAAAFQSNTYRNEFLRHDDNAIMSYCKATFSWFWLTFVKWEYPPGHLLSFLFGSWSNDEWIFLSPWRHIFLD